MSEEKWIPADKHREDQEYTGPLPVGFDVSVGLSWSKIPTALNIVSLKLQEGRRKHSEPDWVPNIKENNDDAKSKPQQRGRGEWESDKLTHGQAEIVRTVWPLLYAGVIRAFGYRAAPNAPYEWIPRSQWENLKTIDQGGAWAAMLSGWRDAFALTDDEPNWCDVRVVECEPKNTAILTAARQVLPEMKAITGTAVETLTVNGNIKTNRSKTPSEGVHDKRNPKEIDDSKAIEKINELVESNKARGAAEAIRQVMQECPCLKGASKSAIESRLMRKLREKRKAT